MYKFCVYNTICIFRLIIMNKNCDLEKKKKKIKVSKLQRWSHCLSMHFHLIAAHNGSSIAERVFWSRKSFFKSQLLTPSSDFYSEKEYLYMSATSGHCLAPRECLSSTQSTSFEKISWPMDEFQRLDTVHCTMSLANEFRGEI